MTVETTPEADNEGGNSMAHAWRKAFSEGSSAVKTFRWPGLMLWAFGLVLVVGYFNVAWIHDYLEQIGSLKKDWGYLFSFLSTAFFGGFVPALITQPWKPANKFFSYVLTNTLFWGVKGMEVDLLYRWQSVWFGDSMSVGAITGKVLIDQFVYCPLMGLLNVVLFYFWRDCNYSIQRFYHEIGQSWYLVRVVPLMISNWCVWIPAVVLVYCLPLALQVPVQNLILCFWVLIIFFFTNNKDDQPKSTAIHSVE